MLEGKTVLLLAPQFFGYEKEIQSELESLGARVIYFDERPKNDFLTKVLIRLNWKSLIYRRINNYYKSIIDSVRGVEINYLFMVAPETIPVSYIDKLKLLHNDMRVFSYFWDSVRNKRNALSYLSLSDRFFSFDSKDISFDKKIEFLPLFYIKDYENVKKTGLHYDIAFIGTAHSDRYELVKKIELQANFNNLKVFYYFYSPSKILFHIQKLFKKEFKNFNSSDISFKFLSKHEVIEMVEKSNIVIDIHHPLQDGLTMRTIEMLGARKKIITTNGNVKEYDFYDESNISIIDRKKPVLDINFCLSNYRYLEINIYKEYSLKNWLIKIFTE